MTARSLSQAPSGTMDETPARKMSGHVIRQIAIVGAAAFWAAIGAAVWSALT